MLAQRRADRREALGQERAARCRASRKTWSLPVAAICRTIALATTSRGASSASSCWPTMNRSPSTSTSSAPSPRTASEISVCCPRAPGAEPQHGRVELHELQVGELGPGAERRGRARRRWPPRVRRRGRTPARCRRSPAPPRARGRRRRRRGLPSPMTCRLTPQAGPGAPSASGAPVSTSRTRACSITSMPGSSRTASRAATRARRPRPRWRRRRRARSGRRGARPRGSAAPRRRRRCRSARPRAIRSRIAVRALGDQRAHGVLVAQARAGDQGVLQVGVRGCRCRRAPRRPRPAPTASSPLDSTVLVTSSTRGTRRRSRSAAVARRCRRPDDDDVGRRPPAGAARGGQPSGGGERQGGHVVSSGDHRTPA